MIAAAKLDWIVARTAMLRDEALRALRSSEPADEAFDRACKELSALEPVVARIGELRAAEREVAEAGELLGDPEMRELAVAELRRLEIRIPELKQAIRVALLPRDEADARSAIIEVRRGSGGGDAEVFASDLFIMYEKYAALRGWKFEVLEHEETELGGTSYAVARVDGCGVFARLKYESGVHRVTRVPVTDHQARRHRGSATVVVLPVAEATDVHIGESDLCIEVHPLSASDASHSDKSESAVRVTHIPTGIVVTALREKTQQKNLANAAKILHAHVYEQKRRGLRVVAAAGATSPVEHWHWVRSYNYPENRVSDSRIGTSVLRVDDVMRGEFDRFIDALIADEQAKLLVAVAELEDGSPGISGR